MTLRALTAALAGLLGAAPGGAAPAVQASELVGAWQSPAPENLGPFFATRTFVFTEGSWALVLKTAADEKFSVPLFTHRIDGTYLVGGPAREPAGATDAVFFYSRRYVRADSPAGVDLFRKQGCMLELGLEKDISLVGCGFLPAIPVSGIEYDLLSMSGKALRLGDRSADLSKQRPTRLSVFALVRP